ncbi:UNVERIFIED_CONTAM: hypothetical protein FKN15_058958 [Acipenser sinensis]
MRGPAHLTSGFLLKCIAIEEGSDSSDVAQEESASACQSGDVLGIREAGVQVEGVVNTLCGYKTLDKERLELGDVIYVRGCIHAVYLWFGDNIGATIGLCCALFLPQLFGIILTCLFWTKLKELSLYRTDQVDFKALRQAGFQYSELDLSGAGWCLCLPREGGYLPVPESELDLWSPEPENPDEPPIEIVPGPRTSPDLSRTGTKQNLGLDEVDFRV